jgi:anti-sigma B factor antagonist
MNGRAPIQVKIEPQSTGIVVLRAVGDIGYHEAPTLRQGVREAYDKKPSRLVIDLSGVAYMATPGVATLVEALQISKRTGTALVLFGLTDRVRAVFEIARLISVFKITPDEASALA